MKILDEIPPQLKGRGHPQCVPMQCEVEGCGCLFLHEYGRGVYVVCPHCKTGHNFVDDDQFVPFNGQARD